jgi:transcriptional regulator with XRE-family HTH domain
MKESRLKSILGKNVRFFRLRKQLSQADLAEQANISITFLSNIERGNNYPQAGTLCSIASVLGVNEWELLKEEVVFDNQKAIIDRISEDFTKHVNLALETVYEHYKI